MRVVRVNSELLFSRRLQAMQAEAVWFVVGILPAHLQESINENRFDDLLISLCNKAAEEKSAHHEPEIYLMRDDSCFLLFEGYLPSLGSALHDEALTTLSPYWLRRLKSPVQLFQKPEDQVALVEQAYQRLTEASRTPAPAQPKTNQPLPAGDHLSRKIFAAAAKARPTRTRPCALIVEDQAFSRQMLRQMLVRNCDIYTAADGPSAIALYESHAPDIVFLDIDVPVLDGHDVLHYINVLDPASYVVMLTASRDASDVRRALAENAKGYICKPYAKQKVIAYIEECWDRHLLQQRIRTTS